VNTATVDELRTLPGVGPAMAHRIVECRGEDGYASIDDLLRVPGLGPARLAELRPSVSAG
jgi:competence protein ComEA